MSKILIKNVEHQKEIVDVFIADGIIQKIEKNIIVDSINLKVMNGENKAILPAFYNGHTHSPMSLFRGFADDYDLHTWLNDYIFPAEKMFDEKDVYFFSRLSILEMIKSGCCFFNDMYWFQEETIKAINEMQVRACVGLITWDSKNIANLDEMGEKLLANRANISSKIQLSIAPHAIYTTGTENLKKAIVQAKKHNLPLHMHISESEYEVDFALKNYGKRPVEYLNDLGFFDCKVFAVHGIHFSDNELDILSQNDVTIVYNPCSNMKLVCGNLQYKKLKEKHIPIILGTDGCASNNNLSLFDEMKTAALLAKFSHQDSTIASAREIYKSATQVAAETFGINGGIIEEGKVADCILVDLENPLLVGFDLISNMVYSADSSVIDSVICGGNILMENKIVANEKEIVNSAKVRMQRFFESRKK